MLVAGVDPGASGAVAFYDSDTGEGWGEVVDTTDGVTVAALLRAHPAALVAVEVPVGRPPEHGGWKQIAGQWRAIGCVEGVVAALGLPMVRVTPRDWQAIAYRGHAKPKAYAERKRLSLRLARERWPGAKLDRVKDGAIGEALFVALTVAQAEHNNGKE